MWDKGPPFMVIVMMNVKISEALIQNDTKWKGHCKDKNVQCNAHSIVDGTKQVLDKDSLNEWILEITEIPKRLRVLTVFVHMEKQTIPPRISFRESLSNACSVLGTVPGSGYGE